MGILLFIVFGAIVGWIASIIMHDNARMGLLANIIVGIVGSFLGSLLANLIGSTGVSGFNIRSFIVALIGAVVLLFIVNAIRGRRAHSA